MSKPVFCLLFLAALILALAFRLTRLDLRPMHHDEANQALKFAALLETGEYRYDRNDHHGPTLYYLTLPFALARGQRTLPSLNETTLRMVPALCGAFTILLFGLLVRGLGCTAIVFSALFCAVSPSLTYYSRFYIQESLLLLFSMGFLVSLGRYARKPCYPWALSAGACAGLAYATKETSILIFAAAGAALILARRSAGIALPGAGQSAERRGNTMLQILAAAATAIAIAMLFYSSFFRNPQGILESLASFGQYASRGVEAGLHAHPWYFYLQILTFSRSSGIIWSEGFILILALLAGIMVVCRLHWVAPAGDRFWLRYILCYSFLTALAFSLIRYKTPWNLLVFHAGFTLLAGTGAGALLHRFRSSLNGAIIVLAILAGVAQLGVVNWRANFAYPADPRNPYVYAQTSPDVLRLSRRIHDLAAVHVDGASMLVKVVAGPYEQWPLPWYFRDLQRVGYWTAPGAAPEFSDVPVVIASQQYMEYVGKILGDRCQIEYYGLRPEVLLTVFVDRSLWERYVSRK
jgi:uncharacterized protein (TIGR03663 family)